MTGIIELQAQVREKSGKGPSRRLKAAGMVPAIIYGLQKDAVMISADVTEFMRRYREGNFKSRLVDIALGKDKIRTIPRDVQLHPVTDLPEHVDFMRVNDDSIVNVFVPVNFVNYEQSPGLKRGGVLSVIRREIELLCVASKIPQMLTVDLSGLQIGDSVHFSSITLSEGVQPTITDRDFTIATVVGRVQKTAEEIEEEEAAEAAAAEGDDASEDDEAAAQDGDQEEKKESSEE